MNYTLQQFFQDWVAQVEEEGWKLDVVVDEDGFKVLYRKEKNASKDKDVVGCNSDNNSWNITLDAAQQGENNSAV